MVEIVVSTRINPLFPLMTHRESTRARECRCLIRVIVQPDLMAHKRPMGTICACNDLSMVLSEVHAAG